MKKSLIALAVLAASGAAMAQSSVTLYGVVDTYFGQRSTETTGAVTVAKLTQTVVNPSGFNTSRWGMRGTEDLGGGLSASFALEAGIATDTGAVGNITPAGNTVFGRAANVSLKGGFGTVTLGRQFNAYDLLRGANDNVWASNFSTTPTVFGTGIQDEMGRINNSVAYYSPDFSGFSGSLNIGLGENKTATADAERSTSLQLRYAKGPLGVGYARLEEKQVAGGNYFGAPSAVNAPATAVGVTDTRKYDMIAASYDFGPAKLNGSYNRVTSNPGGAGDITDKEYQLGVTAPFGKVGVGAGYARSVSTTSGQADLVGPGFALVGTYELSKRTMMYAAYTKTKVESDRTAIRTSEVTLLGLGVKHVF